MSFSMEELYYDILKKKLQFEERRDERNFLICKSCFWCASFLHYSLSQIINYPENFYDLFTRQYIQGLSNVQTVMKIKVITRSRITELMTGHPRLVAVVIGVGLTFAVATTLSILVGQAFAHECCWSCKELGGCYP